MTMINRDPFARVALCRSSIAVSAQECDWCGAVRLTKGGNPYLYKYSTESDGGHIQRHTGLFCSKSCHDDYHS